MGSLLRLIVLVTICIAYVQAESKPNIIIILADDLGYGDLSSYGHPDIKTPVLDQMAKDGIRLTNFYAGASVCTPSRMALLSGSYPARVGWEKGVIGYKMGPLVGLHPDVVTIAEIFKASGYATGMAGKWHVGSDGPCLPHNQGFDSAYYIDKSNNLSKEIYRNGSKLDEPFVNRLLTEKFTSEALRFINANHDKPFFLYMPYSAPHFPVEAHPDWEGKSAYGEYGDVVEELDHRIGDILALLKTHNIADNTLVLFYSDNGPQGGEKSRAFPHRGLKWSALEGGKRVPCIARWTGKIPAGVESKALVAAMDLLPTLCTAAGIDWKKEVAAAQVVDGVNVLDTLCGKDSEHPRKDLLYWHGMGELQAIRAGDWKLFLSGSGVKGGLGSAKNMPPEIKEALAKFGDDGQPVLFNVADEIGELINHSAEQPQVVKDLLELANKRLDDIRAHSMPLYTK